MKLKQKIVQQMKKKNIKEAYFLVVLGLNSWKAIQNLGFLRELYTFNMCLDYN